MWTSKAFYSIDQLVQNLLKSYVQGVYHEYPVYDNSGNLLGHEWYGIHGGQVEYTPIDSPPNQIDEPE